MTRRALIAALCGAALAAAGLAAVGDRPRPATPPEPDNFPRPMPSLPQPKNFHELWQSLRELLRPKLGPVPPSERWI